MKPAEVPSKPDEVNIHSSGHSNATDSDGRSTAAGDESVSEFSDFAFLVDELPSSWELDGLQDDQTDENDDESADLQTGWADDLRDADFSKRSRLAAKEAFRRTLKENEHRAARTPRNAFEKFKFWAQTMSFLFF